tara:strand:+ start:259 stop:744 length:486 start_codon:yes stop_codon:yes gene_type:complete
MPLTHINEAKRKAMQQFDAAFFLMHTTYPVVKDPKLLIGIIHNLTQSFEYAIDAVLAYERQLRLIPPYPEDAKFKFNLFRDKTMRRNKIPSNYVTLLMDLKEFIELQKKCPVEFQRGNRYVLCNKNYQVKTVSLKDIKGYIQQTKEFLDIINKITPINRKE